MIISFMILQRIINSNSIERFQDFKESRYESRVNSFLCQFSVLPFACFLLSAAGASLILESSAGSGRVSRSAVSTCSASTLASASSSGRSKSDTRKASNLPSDSARPFWGAVFLASAWSSLAGQVSNQAQNYLQIFTCSPSVKLQQNIVSFKCKFLYASMDSNFGAFIPPLYQKKESRSWHCKRRIQPCVHERLRRAASRLLLGRPPRWSR